MESFVEGWAQKLVNLNNTLVHRLQHSGYLGSFYENLSKLRTSGVLLALLSIYTVSRVVKFFRDLKGVNNLPGFRPLLHPLWFPGAALPSTWWNLGYRCCWNQRGYFYQQFGSEVISIVPLVSGYVSLYTNNLDVARQVIGGGQKTSFIKPEYASQSLLKWGMNLIAADGDIWRKHRRILGPAFTNKLYEFVWNESLRTYKEMVSSEGWLDKKSVDVPVAQRITFKYTLFIIGKCAFGLHFNWSDPPTTSDGSMTLQEALGVTTSAFLSLMLAPKWAFKLPIKRLRQAKEGQDRMTEFMKEYIEERRKELRTDAIKRDDVFTRLVQANEDEESKYKLGDDELIGNVFMMLFAGHETTAHTLAATLGFLAYYSEVQEEVYEHILSVIGKTRDPVLADYNKLEKVIAVFFEALRMFPAGHVMIRAAREDTVLTIPNPDGVEGTRVIPVPKGMQVVVDMIGVQYNPRYFDEPEKFRPSRWYGVPVDSEIITAFSVGPRACLGRKFGMTESIAFLTMLLRGWKVEPSLSGGETKEQWKERVLDAHLELTLGVSDVPIRLTRRD